MLSQPVAIDDVRMLATAFIRHPVVVRQLGGERDANFLVSDGDGRRYVLKVAAPDVDDEETLFETAVLDRLAAEGPTLPVPRVVRAGPAAVVDAGGGRRARMVTFLAGTPLPTRPSAATLHGLGALLARVDAALAGWERVAPSRDLDWDVRRVGDVRQLAASAAEPALVERAIDEYQRVAPVLDAAPAQIIHNDANPFNVVVRGGRVAGLIDFGDIVCAAAVQDLATACAYHVHDGDDPLRDAAAIVAGYHAERPLSATEFGVLPALIGARNALTVLIGTDNARRAPDNSGYLTRNVAAGWRGLHALDRIAPATAAGRLRAAAQARQERMP